MLMSYYVGWNIIYLITTIIKKGVGVGSLTFTSLSIPSFTRFCVPERPLHHCPSILAAAVSLLCLLKTMMMMFLRRKQSQNLPVDDHDSRKDAKVKELRDELGPLSGRNLKYCTDSCLCRYLIARNWNVEKAKKMLEDTLYWRSTFKPEEIRWHEVAHEGETGKVSRADFFDRQGRTVLIMRPGKQNTTSAEGNIRHLVYLIENGILNLRNGQEQMSWLIDFTGWTLSTHIPVRTARDIINILQNHYPERLAVAFLYNPPRFFEAFWKAIKYFLDAKTFEKVKFVYPNNKDSVELMSTFFNIDNLPAEFGGKASLKYDHQEFSKMMVEDEVKTAQFWSSDDEKPSAVIPQRDIYEAPPQPQPIPIVSPAS